MGEQFDKAASLNEIVKAARQCRRGVSGKDGVMEFYITALGSGEALREKILDGRYRARPGTTVEIWRPKHRIATAPWFRDRVWQRSMCNNGVYADLTRGFIRNNMACQTGKGTDMAIRTVIAMLQELYREKPGADIFVKHLDVKRYFPSTPQREIKALDRRKITEPLFIPYLDEIIDMQQDPRPEEEIAEDLHGKRGTGLGSQINQLNQVALPDELDHEVIKICPHYIRFNDDFLLLSHDRQVVEAASETIRRWLEGKGLVMTDKGGVFRAEDGFYFLRKKFILKPTGRIVIRLHPKAMAEERQTLRNLKRLEDEGRRTREQTEVHYQSWVSGAEYAGDGPIRTMDKFYTNLFRRKPRYKRKRRYLYGDRSDTEGAHPPAGARERPAPEEDREVGGDAGICRHDDGRGHRGGGRQCTAECLTGSRSSTTGATGPVTGCATPW